MVGLGIRFQKQNITRSQVDGIIQIFDRTHTINIVGNYDLTG